MKKNQSNTKQKTSIKRYRWEQQQLDIIKNGTELPLTRDDVRNLVKMILEKTDMQ